MEISKSLNLKIRNLNPPPALQPTLFYKLPGKHPNQQQAKNKTTDVCCIGNATGFFATKRTQSVYYLEGKPNAHRNKCRHRNDEEEDPEMNALTRE
jgi:hypothetical protein